MDLHDKAVIEAHRGHLGQHLRAEQFAGFGDRQVCGLCRWVAMIGTCRAHVSKKRPPLAMRRKIARPSEAILAGDLRKPRDVVAKALKFRIDDRIGAIGGDHPALPATLTDRSMMRKAIERTFGRGDQLDIVTFKQCAGPKRLARQNVGDCILIEVCRIGIEPHFHSEHVGKNPVQPHPRWRAQEQLIPLGQ